MVLPVALQLYTVRDEMEKDFLGTLKKVKDMGYAGIEFAGLYAHSAQEVKSMLAQAGLQPVSAHVPLDEFLADTKKTVLTYKEIGCKYVAIPWLEESRRPGMPRYDETAKNIFEIGKIAAENGMTLLYHNHDFEFKKVDGEYVLDTMYRTIPKEYLQTELDTCWINFAGEDPVKYLKKYAGRAPVVHLKDFYKKGATTTVPYALIGESSSEPAEGEKEFEFRPVGYGVQNVPALLAASVEAGAEWIVVEQDLPARRTSLEEAKMSRDYLKTLGW